MRIIPKFITVTGRPGSGKSYLNRLILDLYPGQIEMFVGRSYTTRAPRPDDVVGEYAHIPDLEFGRMDRKREFAWVFSHGDYRLGTRWVDIESAIRSGKISLMTLVPEAVVRLVTAVGREQVVSFFCVAPDIQCANRIRRREAGVEKTLARLASTAHWTPDFMTDLGLDVTELDTSDEDPPGMTASYQVASVLGSMGIVTRHQQ